MLPTPTPEPGKVTPRSLLAAFYAENNLENDGGVNSSSVKIVVSKHFHFYIPNPDSRKRAVVKHDIHHILTGYSAGTITGEGEISAWEVASGCIKYYTAFLIDTSGTMLGFLLNPWKMLKAFARGRRTLNLYHDMFPNEQALDMTVEELKSKLRLDENPIDTKPSFGDFLVFVAFLIYGWIFSVLSVVLLPAVIIYSLYIGFKQQ